MKKIASLVCVLSAVVGYAQNKPIEFTKKIKYKIEVLNTSNEGFSQEEYDSVNYDHYLGKNNSESLLSFYYNNEAMTIYGTSESNYFVKNNWMVPISVSGISQNATYSQYSAFKIVDDEGAFTKLNRKATIKGVNCQYYAILSNPNDAESYEYCFCIDETNKINNAESLFNNGKVKGLIVSAEPKLADYRLVYQGNETASLKLDFDTTKMISDIEAYRTEQEQYAAVDSLTDVAEAYPYEGYNMYSDPLYTYTNANFENYKLYTLLNGVYGITGTLLYNTKDYNNNEVPKYTRDQIIKFYKKQSKSLVNNLSSAKIINAAEKKELNNYFKSQIKDIEKFKPNASEFNDDYTIGAAADVDYAADVAYATTDYDYDYYTKYQSTYNDIKVNDEISLAYDIDVKENDKVKQYAPNYCEDLKNKVPNFQNKELKNNVYNLAGQICDLYLYNNGGNVDYFGTISQIRKSYLEIEKMRSSLSQKDQKSLLEFLKSLD